MLLRVRIESRLNELTVDDLKDKVRVDLRGITQEGTYTLKLQVTPPEGCELEEESRSNAYTDQKVEKG